MKENETPNVTKLEMASEFGYLNLNEVLTHISSIKNIPMPGLYSRMVKEVIDDTISSITSAYRDLREGFPDISLPEQRIAIEKLIELLKNLPPKKGTKCLDVKVTDIEAELIVGVGPYPHLEPYYIYFNSTTIGNFKLGRFVEAIRPHSPDEPDSYIGRNMIMWAFSPFAMNYGFAVLENTFKQNMALYSHYKLIDFK